MILSRSFYPDLCDVPPAANNNVVDTHVCYAAFTPGHMLPDTSCIHLYPLVSTYRRQHVSCIGDTIVVSLSPVCC